jgi:predicted MFS family arabinose efflux permease
VGVSDQVSPLNSQELPLQPERATAGWRHGFRALRHRNFRLFVGGQIVSLVGTFMQTMAQSWLVYRLTGSEWLLGAVWFCAQIPVLVLAPFGGLAADRYSRYRIVIATQALAMLQAFALAALTLTGHVQVWHILVLSTLLGVVNAFDMPGRQSLLIQMTAKEDLLSAISLNSAIFNAARVVGPAGAGVVVAAVGEGRCFLINGVSFLAVIAALAAMRLAPFVPRPAASPWQRLVDGFRYAHRSTPIRTLLLMVASVSICAMPVIVLMPVFADQVFHRGSLGLGWLMGAMGVGAVAGTLVLARRSKTAGLTGVMLSGGIGLGAALIAFTLSSSFYVALVLMGVAGFSVMRQNAAANTLIQTLIPDEYRGRTMALYAMTVVGVAPFGSLAAGALAGHIGAQPTMLVSGILVLAASAWFRIRVRALAGALK